MQTVSGPGLRKPKMEEQISWEVSTCWRSWMRVILHRQDDSKIKDHESACPSSAAFSQPVSCKFSRGRAKNLDPFYSKFIYNGGRYTCSSSFYSCSHSGDCGHPNWSTFPSGPGGSPRKRRGLHPPRGPTARTSYVFATEPCGTTTRGAHERLHYKKRSRRCGIQLHHS